MFTNPLPDNEDYRIFFTDYSERYHIKRFAKEYKGKQWTVTRDSIFQDLKRVHSMQASQQVDELKSGENCKLFKYDFRIAQTSTSPKASGNRAVIFLDSKQHRQDILFVYKKNDLPKNKTETQFIYDVIKSNFPHLWVRLK